MKDKLLKGLSDKSVNLSNVPDLLDIKSMINLIEGLGVKIKKQNNNYRIFHLIRLNLTLDTAHSLFS